MDHVLVLQRILDAANITLTQQVITILYCMSLSKHHPSIVYSFLIPTKQQGLSDTSQPIIPNTFRKGCAGWGGITIADTSCDNDCEINSGWITESNHQQQKTNKHRHFSQPQGVPRALWFPSKKKRENMGMRYAVCPSMAHRNLQLPSYDWFLLGILRAISFLYRTMPNIRGSTPQPLTPMKFDG